MKKIFYFYIQLFFLLFNFKPIKKKIFLVGERIQTTNKDYYLLLNVLAKPITTSTNATNQNLTLSNNLLLPNERLLKKEIGFDIYQTNNVKVQIRRQSLSSLKKESTTNKTKQDSLVVWNNKTRDFGILTGSILIKLKNFQEKDRILQEYQLVEKNQFEQLNIIFAKVRFNRLISTLDSLRNDSRVSRVEVDIIENTRVPY